MISFCFLVADLAFVLCHATTNIGRILVFLDVYDHSDADVRDGNKCWTDGDFIRLMLKRYSRLFGPCFFSYPRHFLCF